MIGEHAFYQTRTVHCTKHFLNIRNKDRFFFHSLVSSALKLNQKFNYKQYLYFK